MRVSTPTSYPMEWPTCALYCPVRRAIRVSTPRSARCSTRASHQFSHTRYCAQHTDVPQRAPPLISSAAYLHGRTSGTHEPHPPDGNLDAGGRAPPHSMGWRHARRTRLHRRLRSGKHPQWLRSTPFLTPIGLRPGCYSVGVLLVALLSVAARRHSSRKLSTAGKCSTRINL